MRQTIYIEKRSYSAKPWRLVNAHGKEIYQLAPYPVPSDTPMPPIQQPMAYDTKADAIEALGELAGEVFALREQVQIMREMRGKS